VKVLHVYTGNMFGGIETFLRTLLTQAGAREHEAALGWDARLASELRAQGARVHVLGAMRYRHPWTLLAARRALARLLSERAFDGVVLHSSWVHTALAPAVADTRRAFFLHTPVEHVTPSDLVGRLHPPRVVLTNSAFTAAQSHRYFPGVPARVVGCPVEMPGEREASPAEARRVARAELGARDDERVVLCAARFDRLKGHALLIDALAGLPPSVPWVAWIAGEAQQPHERTYLAELHERARRRGVHERIRWLGYRSDVHGLMSAADVLCQPNVGPEGFGIVLVEAMARGLPVVCTAMGGALEIVDERSGLCVPADAASVAAALHRVFGDDAMRARLRTSGPARARQIASPDRVLAGVERALREHLP
jgi:glycosyltransferase involved in cell wall biosynthesis